MRQFEGSCIIHDTILVGEGLSGLGGGISSSCVCIHKRLHDGSRYETG